MIISWPQVPKNCIKLCHHQEVFGIRDLAGQTLTPLNKRVEKGIGGDPDRYSQTMSSPNAIIIIGGIGWRIVAFLVAVVDTRPYKHIEKGFNIIVVKVRTVIARRISIAMKDRVPVRCGAPVDLHTKASGTTSAA